MSVPFSNTHLRVPRGFGTILEGLAREVLRDQPEDIPKYAAQYFEALLRQREASGVDPAEWAAKLEDRFYNHAFNATPASPEKEPETEVTLSKEKSIDSQTEDEGSLSAEASILSTTQPNVSEEADLTGSTGEEEEALDIAETHIISMDKGLSKEELANRLPTEDVQPEELSGTEEERELTITTFDEADRAANEKDSSSVSSDQDIPQSELEPAELSSYRGISEELEMAENEVGDKQDSSLVDKQIIDSEGQEKTEAEEPVEVYPYSGLADVDVCATELIGTEMTMGEATAEDDRHVTEEESSKPEETVLQSPLSQSETRQENQREAEDQEETTKEEEGTETEASSGGIRESLTHIEGDLDSAVTQKEDSLVEINFEDVPEAQQMKEDEKKQTGEEDGFEVLQTNELDMHQKEESKEVTAEATDQNTPGAQDRNESELVGDEQEVCTEGEEMESDHETADVIKEKVDTNESNVNDSKDDKKGDGVKSLSSSRQPTTEADEEDPENETDHTNEETGRISEGQSESNDPDFKEEETTETAVGDKEDVDKEGDSEVEDQDMNDAGETDSHSSQVTQSNISAAAVEAESQTLEAIAEESVEDQRIPVESQLEDTGDKKEVTSKEGTSEAEGVAEEEKSDSEVQEKSDAPCSEGSEGVHQPAADHHREERPLGSEKETGGDKQEDCSRPQEEEDIMDIPLDDPEANRAAAKIQAGFRGHMTRKKMKPEDKAEGEEVSSTGDVLNGSQGDTETGGSGPVERSDTSVPEQ